MMDDTLKMEISRVVRDEVKRAKRLATDYLLAWADEGGYAITEREILAEVTKYMVLEVCI